MGAFPFQMCSSGSVRQKTSIKTDTGSRSLQNIQKAFPRSMRFCFHCWKFKEPVADLLSQRSDLLPIVSCWSGAKYLMGIFLCGIVQSTVTGGWSGSWEAAYAIKVFLTTMTRQPGARNIGRLISITKHFSKQNKYTGNGGLFGPGEGVNTL